MGGFIKQKAFAKLNRFAMLSWDVGLEGVVVRKNPPAEGAGVGTGLCVLGIWRDRKAHTAAAENAFGFEHQFKGQPYDIRLG
jgi:hypothetical protein